MSGKNTNKTADKQMDNIPAGILPGDLRLELFGLRETRKVFALVDGCTIPFAKIDPIIKATIYTMMLADDAAMEDLRHLGHDAALEEFAFCLYGDIDGMADFSLEADPGKAENFICGHNCKCQKWRSKQIMINGHALTRREVQVAQQLATDKPDKVIADELNISRSTLTNHKSNLYRKAGVLSRPGLVEAAFKDRVIQ